MTDKTTENGNDQVAAPTKPTFRVFDGGKEVPVANDVPTGLTPSTEPEIPQNAYVIVDFDDNQHFANGFLLFTSQHVAVMEEREGGPVPSLVLPLSNVKFAQLYNAAEDVEVELPF